MLPIVTYEMLRALHDQRVERSLRAHRLLHDGADESMPAKTPDRVADVVEVLFGPGCDPAQSVGA
jgi:hypothetical protein